MVALWHDLGNPPRGLATSLTVGPWWKLALPRPPICLLSSGLFLLKETQYIGTKAPNRCPKAIDGSDLCLPE